MSNLDELKKYGLFSRKGGIDIEDINEDYVVKQRDSTRQQGFAQMCLAIGYGLMDPLNTVIYKSISNLHLEKMIDTVINDPYPTAVSILGLYAIAGGFVDLVNGQRNHHLTSEIVKKLGFKKLYYKMSAPKRSEMEVYLYEISSKL